MVHKIDFKKVSRRYKSAAGSSAFVTSGTAGANAVPVMTTGPVPVKCSYLSHFWIGSLGYEPNQGYLNWRFQAGIPKIRPQ